MPKIILFVECPSCGHHGEGNELRQVLDTDRCEKCSDPLTVMVDDIRDAQHECLVALGED